MSTTHAVYDQNKITRLESEAKAYRARLATAEAENERLRALLREIAPIMRYEHDAGDGHFSTDQVEAAEHAAQDSGNRT